MLCTVAVLAACGQGEQTSPSGSESVASTSALAGAAKKPRAIPRYVETGDLSGRKVVVHPASSYWESLSGLEAVYGFELVAASDDYDTQDILEDVVAGNADVTLADSHIVSIETTFSNDLVQGLALGEPV